MSSVLTGFSDGSAWERRPDGTIVGRARNGSWAERVRAGVPIDDLVGLEPLGVAPTAPTVAPAVAPTVVDVYDEVGPYSDWWHHALTGYDDAYGHHVCGRYTPWDFDSYFMPTESRRTARARRMGVKVNPKVAKYGPKASKYGPKASKAHTVAARVFAEPVAPSVVMAEPVAEGRVDEVIARPVTPVVPAEMEDTDSLLRRFHAISIIASEWLADLADFAGDVEITEEDLELERQLQRQRNHRYER